ncbi:MAG TPA: hypothetical protein VMV33_17185 [Rhodocyclaceae bacterium]|nr:hypothetical protein [Rhodocyclaceae bacterium]
MSGRQGQADGGRSRFEDDEEDLRAGAGGDAGAGGGDDAGGGGEDDAAVEARARKHGWKPLAEFRGDPKVWRSAAEYLARGDEELPILRERLRTIEQRSERAEARARAAEKLQEEALAVSRDVSARLRTADERALAKARRELEARRDEAIDAADREAVRAVDRELQELETTAAPPARQPPAADVGAGGAGATPHPDAVAWGRRNPWFGEDSELRSVATGVHTRLLAAEPDLSLAQNLERVTAAMAAMFPDRVQGAPARRRRDPDDEDEYGAGGRNERDDDRGRGRDRGARDDSDGDRRRRQPAAVDSGQEAPSRRQRGGARSFANMPAESKEAFQRYRTALASKPGGKDNPLTEAEWAKTYWDQFEEQ